MLKYGLPTVTPEDSMLTPSSAMKAAPYVRVGYSPVTSFVSKAELFRVQERLERVLLSGSDTGEVNDLFQRKVRSSYEPVESNPALG